MQRRTLLKLGYASAAALALAGGGVATFLAAPAWHAGRLTEVGRGVLGSIARAILDGSLPAQAQAQAAALASHFDRLDSMLRTLPPSAQSELNHLLSVLAIAPGRLALAGLATDWTQASVEHVQAALQSMRHSRIDLRKQAYHALRDLTQAAYFASPDTWPQLGYPGPVKIA